ncbi:MAG TPA: diiron oxygenase [Acidimicrobiales bacterium]|nr:diiron oxygenase [Acidimicrobiales bacterium]
MTTRTETRQDVFAGIVARLSRQSVDKHFAAYEDIDWDAPDMAVDARDPRFCLSVDVLGATDWYRALPEERRALVGLHRVATAMQVGAEFENLLQRGLLAYAYRLPPDAPEFRYLHHEVIEESQHSMMFREFVRRSRTDVRGMPRWAKAAAAAVVPLNRVFPELFFLFVLGGEDPVDLLQRRQLRAGIAHPLVERIMRIHVTEEARHLSFARQYLKLHVPELGWARRQVLSFAAPALLGVMARLMLLPSPQLVHRFGVPRRARRQAWRNGGAALVRDSVGKPRRLCVELGLVHRPARALWRLLGIWSDEPAPGDGETTDAGRAPAAA